MAEEAVQSVKCDSLESEPEDRQRFLKKNKSPVNQVSRDYITLRQDFNSFYSLPNSLRVSHFLSKIERRGDSINFKIYLKNSTFCWVFWFKREKCVQKVKLSKKTNEPWKITENTKRPPRNKWCFFWLVSVLRTNYIGNISHLGNVTRICEMLNLHTIKDNTIYIFWIIFFWVW